MNGLRTITFALMLMPVVAMAELQVVIIEGLGGEERYTEQFDDQVAALDSAAKSMTDDQRVRVFRVDDVSRQDVIDFFDELASSLDSDDRLAVFLIGHGSYDDYQYKFNIPGPDLTDDDLVAMLDNAGAGSQLVVNTSSSSGATIDPLRSDERTLILATRSGAERHATRFGHYFAIALADPTADTDKNRIVSAEEAFAFAERQVADYFERNGQLATEHARLEGSQASRFGLARLGAARPTSDDAILRDLLSQRDALNSSIDDLRSRRDSMSVDDYQSELLGMMLELATLEDAIEEREGELASED